jgi:hypothetical protein
MPIISMICISKLPRRKPQSYLRPLISGSPSILLLAFRARRGFIEWPGDIDLAPDAMYEEISTQGVWVLE